MEYLTPANVQLGLCGIYAVAGAPKLLGASAFQSSAVSRASDRRLTRAAVHPTGLATKPFKNDLGYPVRQGGPHVAAVAWADSQFPVTARPATSSSPPACRPGSLSLLASWRLEAQPWFTTTTRSESQQSRMPVHFNSGSPAPSPLQRVEGFLLLLVVMGGGIVTMLKMAPPMAASPAGFAYAIFYCLKAHKAADPMMVGGALALGALGGVLFDGRGKTKGGKTPAKKPAASKKSK